MLPIIEQSPLDVLSTTALPTSETLITEWNIGQRTISLFYGARNTLVAVDGRDGTREPFLSTLYSVEYAANLIEMFHRTIQVNLEREGINDYCFLPKLCIEAQNAPEITVALFGDRDTSSNDEEEPRVLRWGVFNSSTREEYPVETNDPLSEIFIRHAPATDIPHMRLVLDANGQAIMKDGKAVMEPAFNHYAMTSYAKRFGVVIERDATDRIQNVVLHRVSLLDKNVLLDHTNWAVTLVSTKSSSQTQNILGRWLGEYAGHAMLACEGVEEDTPFLRYIHLTQNPRERIPNLAADQAQIESFDRSTPLDTVNAPTWVRSKALVENMFIFVTELENQPVKFALYGNAFSSGGRILGEMFLPTRSMGSQQVEELRIRKIEALNLAKQTPHHCLQWAIAIAGEGGIFFTNASAFTTPLKTVTALHSAPIFAPPVDYLNIGNRQEWSICFRNRRLVSELLSAYVILIPPNSSPGEVLEWVKQRDLEYNNARALVPHQAAGNLLLALQGAHILQRNFWTLRPIRDLILQAFLEDPRDYRRYERPERFSGLKTLLDYLHVHDLKLDTDMQEIRNSVNSPFRESFIPEMEPTPPQTFFGQIEKRFRGLAGTLHRNMMPLITFKEVPRDEYRRPPRIPLDTIRSIFFGGPEHDEARRRYPLADEASKVKNLYEQLKLNPRIRCPEAAALSEYWKEEPLQAKKAYDHCKTQDARNDLIGHKKIELDSEKVAKTLKLEHLFWKTLSNDTPHFESVFLEHGVDAHSAISEFATWDTRDADKRFWDRVDRNTVYRFHRETPTVEDILLTFNNPDIRPITYSLISNNDLEGFNERRFIKQAFIRALTEIPESRAAAV
jgi:hypothetical protein